MQFVNWNPINRYDILRRMHRQRQSQLYDGIFLIFTKLWNAFEHRFSVKKKKPVKIHQEKH